MRRRRRRRRRLRTAKQPHRHDIGTVEQRHRGSVFCERIGLRRCSAFPRNATGASRLSVRRPRLTCVVDAAVAPPHPAVAAHKSCRYFKYFVTESGRAPAFRRRPRRDSFAPGNRARRIFDRASRAACRRRALMGTAFADARSNATDDTRDSVPAPREPKRDRTLDTPAPTRSPPRRKFSPLHVAGIAAMQSASRRRSAVSLR
jgi:hypothetical protein